MSLQASALADEMEPPPPPPAQDGGQRQVQAVPWMCDNVRPRLSIRVVSVCMEHTSLRVGPRPPSPGMASPCDTTHDVTTASCESVSLLMRCLQGHV